MDHRFLRRESILFFKNHGPLSPRVKIRQSTDLNTWSAGRMQSILDLPNLPLYRSCNYGGNWLFKARGRPPALLSRPSQLGSARIRAMTASIALRLARFPSFFKTSLRILERGAPSSALPTMRPRAKGEKRAKDFRGMKPNQSTK